MSDLKQRLSADHDELERQLRELAHAIATNDAASDLHQCWQHFEASLREHLDAEERTIFPVVAAAHRPEVEALRADHQFIRESLAELGLALELHTLRKAAVDELITFLSQHAARENGTLYAWIDHEEHRHLLRPLLAMFGRHPAHRSTNSAEATGTRSSTS
jgi:hemerythrin-like domain-containing protein